MSFPQTDPARLFAAFDELVDLDAPLRDARLAGLDADDPELARALRQMLQADRMQAGSLEAGVRTLVHALAAGTGDSEPRPNTRFAGQQIGPYQLVRPLGAGGMGEVWLAQRDGGGFQQQVALKLLRGSRGGSEAVRRFLQERRILADLSHPSIARFIDGGIDADGSPWYAMEHIVGMPLDEHARRRAGDARARVRLILEIANAVAYAQAHLVIHRDLKPSNVLVDAEGRVHLLDFGIAKLIEASHGADGATTGWLAMSPAYAAPEQILGQSVSTATDVYALGSMLYELLTGSLPHVRNAQSLEQMVQQAREETIEAPAHRLRRRGNQDTASADTKTSLLRIDLDLDTIVVTALQRDPQRRYAGAAPFADDLTRWLDGRPIAARPDTSAYRMRKFVGRHRLAVGSASAVLLALIAGFGVALWQAHEARTQARLAAASAAEARRAVHETESMNQFLSNQLTNAIPTISGAGRELTMMAWVTAALTQLDTELRDAPLARATLRHQFGLALRELGNPEASLGLLEQALAEHRTLGPTSLNTAVALHSFGATHYDLGRVAEARAEVTAAIATFDALPVNEHVRVARLRALTTLLRIEGSEGRYAQMLAIAERNIVERGALFGPNDPRLAVDYNNLSAALVRVGRLGDAETALRKSLALLLAGPNPPPARVAMIEQSICAQANQRAQWSGALEACASALARCEGALGADHEDCISIRVSQLRTYLAMGEETTARRMYPGVRSLVFAGTDRTDQAELLRTAIRLSIIDADWAAVRSDAASLLTLVPPVPASARSPDRQLAAAYAALGTWMSNGPDGARVDALRAADALLAEEAISATVAASAALVAAIALDRHGDAGAAASYRERGIAEFTRNMPAAEAEALWQRSLPRTAAQAVR